MVRMCCLAGDDQDFALYYLFVRIFVPQKLEYYRDLSAMSFFFINLITATENIVVVRKWYLPQTILSETYSVVITVVGPCWLEPNKILMIYVFFCHVV